MINVPDEVKDLFHQDTCYKNIRIHFPNGERSDICNDLIVKDSVSFKESLCSQNTLKFGLCESPLFECEVVSVENIKGATIEVSCEIECPATVTGAEWRIDLQKYVYSIPYGTFVVYSCQRQADMIHRKIVAYDAIATKDWTVAEKETKKVTYNNYYNPNMGYFLAANGIDMLRDEVDITEVTSADGLHSTSIGHYSDPYTGRIEISTKTIAFGTQYITDYDAVYKSVVHYSSGINESSILNKLQTFFKELDDSWEKDYVINWCAKAALHGEVSINYRVNGSGYANSSNDVTNEYYYPYIDNFYTNSNNYTDIEAPYKITISVKRYGEEEPFKTEEIILTDSDPVYYKYKYKNNSSYWTSVRQSFACPLNSLEVYTPDFSSVDLNKVATSLAELTGMFFMFGRSNRLINIKQQFELLPEDDLYPGSNLHPEGVTGGKLLPQDYQSCWYDDDYTKMFGAITCQYKKSQGENTVDATITIYLPGFNKDTDPNTYMVYELKDNELIKSAVWTDAQITSICNTIANNIEGVTYMPVEFKGRGLPYVEAGDTFEILTRSNDSITTIVLSRTITGEQTLVDSYKSV